ncbi:procollagen-proline 4-dioxygenase, partial [Sarracenia purpurea var. burkii]
FNETIQGGETVFPRIGVSVKPAKGLAVVWHNLQSDGSRNALTDHSACPVVMGEKWGIV